MPRQVAAERRERGLEIPGPVEGYVLVDTGATRSSIAEEVASELGLDAVHREAVLGADGAHDAAVYLAELSLEVDAAEGGSTYMVSLVPAAAVPGLVDALDLRDGGGDARLVGLLGREFLQHVVFTYDGPSGRFRIEL